MAKQQKSKVTTKGSSHYAQKLHQRKSEAPSGYTNFKGTRYPLPKPLYE